MSDSPSDFSNPYASPMGEEAVATTAASDVLPLTREIWIATLLIWCACGGLGLAASYVLVAWLDHKFRWNLRIDHGAELAQFATGAANALVMSGLMAYGQYYAVVRRDSVWTRSLGLLLLIGSVVIALGSLLLFAGTLAMWLMLMPAALTLLLSLLMFRWYSRLWAFKRAQRRNRKP